jgi:hypothetical protein
MDPCRHIRGGEAALARHEYQVRVLPPDGERVSIPRLKGASHIRNGLAPASARSDTDTRTGPVDAKSLSGTRAQLGHQNQPPDGSRPLMRRYVTRLP